MQSRADLTPCPECGQPITFGTNTALGLLFDGRDPVIPKWLRRELESYAEDVRVCRISAEAAFVEAFDAVYDASPSDLFAAIDHQQAEAVREALP